VNTRIATPLLLFGLLGSLPARAQEPLLELHSGDTVCLIGNALAERMQHDGWLEARIQARFPELGLSFRNLGFSGDEVATRQRTAGFGGPDEWLERCGADVIFAFFGYVESFAGEEGLDEFRAELTEFVDHTLAQDYGGGGPPRLVLFTSIPVEPLSDPSAADAAEQNARIEQYNDVIAQVAREAGVPSVDLYGLMWGLYDGARLTINGIHLNSEGNRIFGVLADFRLFADETEPANVEAARALVLEKNHLWFNRYRATDGYNVYGGRSSLRYTEAARSGSDRYAEGVANYDILQRELHVLDGMCANLDGRIQAAARGADPSAVPAAELPALIPVATNKPGPHTYLGGEEALARMTVAEGMEVNLFASEEQFPELVNPVQMAWDTRGRLWVAVWPTYPHWEPGQPMDDKLLIFEDTDGDGRADTSKTFAGDLHNPTGFEFWNGGVLVANCPDLLFLTDTDGDDVYDTKERLLHGLSSADTHHGANSFVLGPDGALYFQEGTFHMSQVENVHTGVQRNQGGCVWRFEPRTHRVERYIPYGFANPHGHVFDRWGQDFMTDGTGNVNYYALPFSGHLEFPDKHRGYFPFFQQRSRPCGGTEFLSSGHFPDANQGNYLVANVIGFQGIFQYEVDDAGSGFGATEVESIVHSSDPNFRPVDIEVGPDGAVYFADWHNVIIGHMQHHLRDPSRDAEHGRVYRVTWKDRPLLDPVPIAGRPIEELLELLKSREDRVRYRARIELSGRDSGEVVALARSWALGLEESGQAGLHDLLEALWVQQQHDALDQELLERLLTCDDHRARAAATRVLRQMRHKVKRPVQLLTAQMLDEHPRVRLEALVACSFFRAEWAPKVALMALSKDTDRFLNYALEETIRALEPQWREAIGSGFTDYPAGRSALMKRLDTADLKRAGGFAEMLGRHGLEAGDYADAARALAGEDSPTQVLLNAIRTADGGDGGHTDHLIMGLFGALDALGAEGDALREPLIELSKAGRRASTRRLAMAARIEAGGSIANLWEEEATTLAGLGELLDAAPLVDDPELAGDLFPRVLEALGTEPAGTGGTRGRYLRVELPGDKRTLTLAEIEVFSRGDNIAASGTATQSTMNWSGVPERAMDGNKSGRWTDNGQTHTQEDRPNPWWELDLGEERQIDEIVLWNRTDGGWGKRLDDFVVRVLDGERRDVFEHASEGPAKDRNAIELADPSLRVRRSAARAVAALGVREAEAVDALVSRYDDLDLRPALIEGMRTVPFARWSNEARLALATRLVEDFGARSREDFASNTGRQLLALADELAPHLDAALSSELRDRRRRLGPQVFVIRPVPDALLFDRTEITVVAGHPVEIVFDNGDLMPHNLLISTPGSLATVGMAAEAMAQDPDAWDKAFVPDLPEVLETTGLLQPGSSETLRFVAPEAPGDYPYVCTFPGHWVRMNGVMHVVADWNDVALTTDEETVEATAAPARPFVRNWTEKDLGSHLRKVARASAERGRTILEAATCLSCHAVDGEGGTTGPDLRETVARHEDVAQLLAQIVSPSAQILEGYESEIFITTDGRIVSGRVIRREGSVILIQDDPYRDDYLELAFTDIEEKTRSNVSLMPSGLLSTFQRDEILDLLAYLESLR
jgi:putative heme-binding domain-containing protein